MSQNIIDELAMQGVRDFYRETKAARSVLEGVSERINNQFGSYPGSFIIAHHTASNHERKVEPVVSIPLATTKEGAEVCLFLGGITRVTFYGILEEAHEGGVFIPPLGVQQILMTLGAGVLHEMAAKLSTMHADADTAKISHH